MLNLILHLLVYVPACATIGFLICSLLTIASRSDKQNTTEKDNMMDK